MYTWGSEDTSKWKSPGAYKYDSKSKSYMDKLAADSAKKGPRSYQIGDAPDDKLVGTKSKTIKSDSENLVVIATDVTGSMCSWPAEIFDRAPLIYQTLSQYKKDVEICFAAIGDAFTDQYPLQVNDFDKGVSLDDKIKAMYPEGMGGGQISESYELFAYYMDKHCEMPKAKKPIMIIFGDEKFYDEVNANQIGHYIGDRLQNNVNSEKTWKSLMNKFEIYYLQKPYGDRGDAHTTKEVHDHWANVLGPQRIIKLYDSTRAVDVAIGLISKLWGKFPDFSKSIEARQDEKTVEKVDDVL